MQSLAFLLVIKQNYKVLILQHDFKATKFFIKFHICIVYLLAQFIRSTHTQETNFDRINYKSSCFQCFNKKGAVLIIRIQFCRSSLLSNLFNLSFPKFLFDTQCPFSVFGMLNVSFPKFLKFECFLNACFSMFFNEESLLLCFQHLRWPLYFCKI